MKGYLPAALQQGKLLAKPDPLAMGVGLKDIQNGVDRIRDGVSAQKLVVSMEGI